MTTTTTVNTNTIVLPPLQQQMNDTNNLLDVGSDDGVVVAVGVGNMEEVVGLEGTLQPSGLHQLF